MELLITSFTIIIVSIVVALVVARKLFPKGLVVYVISAPLEKDKNKSWLEDQQAARRRKLDQEETRRGPTPPDNLG